ncbi:hypothetical protein [Pleomorphomonas carboxyditropha]|uniref:Uncharacterized protein n=1 Tax=Pleomorphomonas carboxyditropha TaxID=2023338 RepID=A0A2G9WV96_9HYPH|nr:hypothetical protein [Pleomorphomonas carboxyditropha]PIO98584.1 hypothetical protein CJ014_14800 [Pleomorphomonas carboxyditropha]
MMEPATLAQILAADPLEAWQAAIVARLDALFPGVTVKAHPGKIDISQMIAKTIVPAPGIAVGWSRVRSIELINGMVDLTVDWAAYIVVEAKAIENRAVDRDRLGWALGYRMMMILADREETTWSLNKITPPAEQPAPQLVPLYTVADEGRGVGYLAATWSQTLVAQGAGLYDAPAPMLTVTIDDDGRASAEADFGDNVPIEVRDLWEVDP